jgi:hypothetical protein
MDSLIFAKSEREDPLLALTFEVEKYKGLEADRNWPWVEIGFC